MLYGTSYFVSRAAAIRYYRDYGPFTGDDLNRKLAEGEIHIGKPEIEPGETLSIIDDGTRYAIERPAVVTVHPGDR